MDNKRSKAPVMAPINWKKIFQLLVYLIQILYCTDFLYTGYHWAIKDTIK